MDRDDIYYTSSIGVDEVGTGEVLRPQVFVACYVPTYLIMTLEDMGVKDSKKMSRNEAIRLGKKLAEMLDFEEFKLTNKRLNEVYEKSPNLNKIKAICHNRNVKKLLSRIGFSNLDKVIIDAFCSKEKYIEHINEPLIYDDEVLFITKGEDAHIAVACASLIATYIEELMLEDLESELGEKIPGGNTKATTSFLAHLKETRGDRALRRYAKLNFTPVQNLLTKNN